MSIPSGKPAKMPKLHVGTKLLSFDLEANGLHGEAFAVGGLVIDGYGKTLSEFTARCSLAGTVDPWVKQNILPALAQMPVTHDSYIEMREAFWQWFVSAEQQSDYVLVNNGYPVEYRFLIDCQQAALNERYWQHPYPILDLSSLLLQIGNKISRTKLSEKVQKMGSFRRHHPFDDAKVAALMAFEAFQQSGQIN